jgi:hypothetical protein
MSRDFSRIDDYPDGVSAVGILTRLLDGLGFRFYWATQDLVEADYDFAPASSPTPSAGWWVTSGTC